MTLHVKNGGVWKPVGALHGKHAGVWKTSPKAFIKASGVWSQFHNIVIPTSTFIGETGNTTADIDFHSSAVIGDIAVIWLHITGTASEMTISGWNAFATQLWSTNSQARCFYKVLTNLNDVTPTTPTASSRRWHCLIFRGGTTLTEINRVNTHIANPGFTKSASSRRILTLAIKGAGSPTLTQPSGFTEHTDEPAGSIVRSATASIDPASYVGGTIQWGGSSAPTYYVSHVLEIT